ncbi:MAG: hypothetical protein ACYC5N_00695, partial [Endomicrobiales bacterium]
GDTSTEDASEITVIAPGLNCYLNASAKLQAIYEIKDDKAGVGFADSKNNSAIVQMAVKF